VLRILGITHSFADVLNVIFVYATVSSPKPRDSVRNPPTSSLIIVVRKAAVKARSQLPRGLRHWSTAACWLGFGIAFSNPSGAMDVCLLRVLFVCGQVQASVWS
jgi:hypothetical protein